MAEKKLMYYRGYPLIRSGNQIYYGCGGDDFAARLTIKDTKKIADRDVPNSFLVQLIPTRPGVDMGKAKKGEFIGFYEALDAAHIWLDTALFG